MVFTFVVLFGDGVRRGGGTVSALKDPVVSVKTKAFKLCSLLPT